MSSVLLRRWLALPLAGLTLCLVPQGHAQISLSTAVNLALKNNPKVKLAQSDILRAEAILSESKDAFVPAIISSGGVGKATGAPLNPPVVFSIAAQSLVFNSSQTDYIRAAKAGVQSAQAALDAARSDTAEDVANTYLALNNAIRRRVVGAEALTTAQQLVSITEDRFNAGVDPHIELTKARQREAQIRLQQLLVDDDIALQADHLARLTGLAARGLTTDSASIPAMPPPEAPGTADDLTDASQQTGLSAAFAAARAKQYTAFGEKRYLLRPQITFNAAYSRISTAFTTYTQYYPGFGSANNSFNSLNLGVEITVPILDMVHRAKAREAAADAAHSLFDAQSQQMLFLEGRNKLRHSTAELAARRDLARLDQELAADQLDAVLVRLQANAAAPQGEQLSPKDEKNARLQERLRQLDTLTAELQLEQAQVSLMRQEGTLATWLARTMPSAIPGPPAAGMSGAPAGSNAPNGAGAVPTPALPPTVGAPPAAAPAPGQTTPPSPTTGSPPASLPAGPVTSPGATATPTTPPARPHP